MSPRSNPYWLAIDQGGHASRAIVFDRQGNITAQAEMAIRTLTPHTDWVEHDAEEMVKSVEDAVCAVIDQLGAAKHQLISAGMATQRSSIVCWERQTGAALSPIISWQDRRQQQWLKQFSAHNKVIHHKTGLFLSPHYGASKLRWCLDNIEAVATAYKQENLCAGPLASFLAFRLLQERPFCIDPANASRTLLWNLHHNHWDAELCQLFGVPQQLLPRCTRTHEAFGHLVIDDQTLPLTIITGDQPAALFAWGKPRTDTTYINIGTGAFIQRPVTAPQPSDRLLSGIAYLDDKWRCYTLEGTVNGAARALQWLAQGHGIDDLEQRLPEWLKGVAEPALFLNGVSGLGSPYWVANLPSRFIGDGDKPITLKEQAVAIVESIVFLIQRNLEEMEQSLPATTALRVSGGLANLDGLCQRLADITGRIIIRPATTEATARGLAFLIAGRPDAWQSAVQEQRFRPDTAPALQQRYQEWRQLLEHEIDNVKP
jgi:glycerol kinase